MSLFVAAIQTDIAWEDPASNHARLAPRISAAAAAGARLVVLPEMYACGFSMNTAAIAEPVDGPSTRFLREQALTHRVWLGGSLPERSREGERPTNTLVLASPAGQLHRYDKIHPFTSAGEHEHYRAGDRHVTVDVDGVRVTLFVCYDLRFADEFWATALGTDLYVVVANWPEKRRVHWSTLLRARAIENQAYVVGVNRVGEGSGLSYAGDSAIIDPWGEVLAQASRVEVTLMAPVDPARVAEARATFPFLADRR
jgi:predicted amidohydrolase